MRTSVSCYKSPHVKWITGRPRYGRIILSCVHDSDVDVCGQPWNALLRVTRSFMSRRRTSISQRVDDNNFYASAQLGRPQYGSHRTTFRHSAFHNGHLLQTRPINTSARILPRPRIGLLPKCLRGSSDAALRFNASLQFITACTVVQAVVKANSQINGKGQISTPERIST